jgi:predicted Rossmann fold flavoprotein
MYDICIVGGGASGLVLAILLAREDKRVVVFEKNRRVGKRILATGNGRCNITNLYISIDKFYSKNSKFLKKSILKYREIERFFNSIGLNFTYLDDGRVFPLSFQASSVVELLEYELNRLGVEVIYSRVEDIEKKSKLFRVFYEDRRYIDSKVTVVATGNIANSKLGGSSDGLDFAKSFGHKLTPLLPSLVQFTSRVRGLKRVAGVRVEARVSLGDKSTKGDILFTNYGISGLAILDMSFFITEELNQKEEINLSLDLMPEISQKELFNMLLKSIKSQPDKSVRVWLMGFLNRKLIDFLIDIDRTKSIKSLSKREISSIVKSIKSFQFGVNGTKGFEYAEVVRGGVDTRYIESHSMESKLVKGLYFIGEVLDVDGARGGYNLHFAWSSAFRARDGILCSIR